MNGAEEFRPATRRSVRIAGAVAGLGLAASAALHAVWLFSPWPMASWQDWSRAFGADGFHVPAPVMVAVTLLFAAAGYLVAARAALVPRVGPAWIYHAGTWALAAVLLLRSILGFIDMSATYLDPETPAAFRETILLYLRVYLPLFGVLGASSAFVAFRADRPRGRPAPSDAVRRGELSVRGGRS